MTYTSSPRPTYERATHIPLAAAIQHMWGDPEAGEVADWIYVSSDKIHQIVFGLAPRGWFRHSDAYRTIFRADEIYYVLSGVMVIANPETGEVHRVLPGEAAFFRRDTWHHVYNYSMEPLRVVEFFAPPPSQGTSGAYARTRPLLATTKYSQDQWLGSVPMRSDEIKRGNTIQVVGESSYIWRLQGHEHPVLTGLLCATDQLTVGKTSLLPGQQSEPEVHDGDESLYMLEGTLNIRVDDGEGPNRFELQPGDAFYVPEGVSHQYHNISGSPTSFIFGVAPDYLPRHST